MEFLKLFALPKQSSLIILLYWTLFSNLLFAQQEVPLTKAPDLPSPTASSLGIYGDIPVSHYTGIPNIIIPFTSFVGGDLNLDISLSYHGRGVKVEDEAGWAGISWSLNAGGIITRTIRGEDDFPEVKKTYPNSIYSRSKGYFKEASFPNFNMPHILDIYDRYVQGQYEMIHSYGNQYPLIKTFQESIALRGIDGQADIFNFNFNGRSGKFIIDKPRHSGETYNIVLLTKDDLKVELINNDVTGMQGFKVTDEKGVEYWFDKVEKSRSRSGKALAGKLHYEEGVPYDATCKLSEKGKRNIRNKYGEYDVSPQAYRYALSSWYLTKMVSPTGSTINFVYSEAAEYLLLLPSRVQTLVVPVSQPISCIENVFSYSFTISESKNLYLKEIVHKDAKVTFNTSNRSDMQQTNGVYQQKIDNIIYTSRGKQQFRWNFSYSYFDSGSMHPDYIRKRLKLSSVSRVDDNNNTSSYSFEYLDTGTGKLPDKDSFAQDLFGFYNGQLDNDPKNVFLPYFPYYARVGSVNAFLTGGRGVYGDRDVHEQYVTAGMLKKIKYPTGGYTAFEFESNDYANYEAIHYAAGNNHLLEGTGGSITVAADWINLSDPELRKGLGCRIKSITDYAATGALATKKSYSYGWSGKLMYAMKHLSYYNFDFNNSFYKLSSYSQNSYSSSAAGTALGYSEVEERKTGSNGQSLGFERFKFENKTESNNGLFIFRLGTPCEAWRRDIQYTYDYQTPYVFFCNQYPFSSRKDLFAEDAPNITHASNGNLLEHEIYNASYKLVYKKSNTYQELGTVNIRGAAPSYLPINASVFTVLFTEKSVFKALKEVRVFENGKEQLTEYEYDPASRNNQVYSVRTTESDGSLRSKYFTYFSDYGVGASSDPVMVGINSLRAKHIYSPIEIVDEVERGSDKRVVQAQLFTYLPANGKVIRRYLLNTESPVVRSNFTRSYVSSNGVFQKDFRYELREAITRDNLYGNPIEVVSNTSNKAAFVWDYNGQYPIGKAVNALSGEFTIMDVDQDGRFLCNHYDNMPLDFEIETDPVFGYAIAIYSGIGFMHFSNQLDANKVYEMTFWELESDFGEDMNYATVLSSEIVAERGNWNQRRIRFTSVNGGLLVNTNYGHIKNLVIKPADAQVSIYTYRPLVGMTSMTDPRGITEYYKYDGFQRLKDVLDFESNVLKNYQYHYKPGTN
ncbi:hypothetical protein GCM10011418_46420 [Sphingobacterium alkalisoli]|nr:hypothetical protein GCM10011418_46420 [Sphingobacterium alkalisoli]